MTTPYIGEIAMVGFNFAPVGWAMCNGGPLPISQFEVLFDLIGTTYGGDGVSNFNLPDLRSRVPVHQGGSFVMGQTAGQETVQLTVAEIPTHNHLLIGAESSATSRTAGGNLLGMPDRDVYGNAEGTAFNAAAISPAGGSSAHNNLQPYLALSFVIALFGVFPSRS